MFCLSSRSFHDLLFLCLLRWHRCLESEREEVARCQTLEKSARSRDLQDRFKSRDHKLRWDEALEPI